MKWSSALLSEGRNKLGGSVWSRNAAGNYIRARVKPKNPQTASQQANRMTFAQLTSSFQTLSQAQISAWNAAALTVDLQDALGNTIHPSGLQFYVSCNMHLSHAAQTLITEPAANLSPPPAPAISAVSQVQVNEVNVEWTLTLTAAESFGNSTFVAYATPTFSPGINFVAPFMYRATAHLHLGSGGTYNLYTGPGYGQATYLNGQKAAWKIRTVSNTSGVASIASAYSAIITVL